MSARRVAPGPGTRPAERPATQLRRSGLLARAGWWLVAALSLAYFAADLPGRFPPLALHADLFTFAPAPPEGAGVT